MSYSCLFSAEAVPAAVSTGEAPDCLADLNLDQVFAPILIRRPVLAPVFYHPLGDVREITYRQGILHDLHDPKHHDLVEGLSAFATTLDQLLAESRAEEARPSEYHYLSQGHFLDRAEVYCQQVRQLKAVLTEQDCASDGLRRLGEFLEAYCAGADFVALGERTTALRSAFDQIHYCFLLKAGTVSVYEDEDEDDLNSRLLTCFAPFLGEEGDGTDEPEGGEREGEEGDSNWPAAGTATDRPLSAGTAAADRREKMATASAVTLKNYGTRYSDNPRAPYIEEAILRALAKQQPGQFAALADFVARFPHFIDPTLARLAEEIPFYLDWLSLIRPLEQAGLAFCLPVMSERAEDLSDKAGFDLALALRLDREDKSIRHPGGKRADGTETAGSVPDGPVGSSVTAGMTSGARASVTSGVAINTDSGPTNRKRETTAKEASDGPEQRGRKAAGPDGLDDKGLDRSEPGWQLPRIPIVTNDFDLAGPERIIVVTGPNSGGKTTFARTFGQLHYLASLGLCVPGSRARLFCADMVYSHFGKGEVEGSGSGELQDDLLRLHAILSQATPHSVIVVNEIFSSTTTTDALALSRKMMDAIKSLGIPAVVVGFLDELASLGPEVVSMMSMVRPDNPLLRTFTILRKQPDGLAHAGDIAYKYRLDYAHLVERLAGPARLAGPTGPTGPGQAIGGEPGEQRSAKTPHGSTEHETTEEVTPCA